MKILQLTFQHRSPYMKLLLATVTYIAIKERVTCIIAIETIMYIMHCRKSHLHNSIETTICIITKKIVNHIFPAETATCIYLVETYNCIIAIETVTCIISTERSTNIPVIESNTSDYTQMQQALSPAQLPLNVSVA